MQVLCQKFQLPSLSISTTYDFSLSSIIQKIGHNTNNWIFFLPIIIALHLFTFGIFLKGKIQWWKENTPIFPVQLQNGYNL